MSSKLHFLKEYIRGISDYLSGEASDFLGYSYRMNENKTKEQNLQQINFAIYEAVSLAEEMTKIKYHLLEIAKKKEEDWK